MRERLFFSIIIPAHNEEDYIERTLDRLVEQDYPKDRYEVLVVENGSYDKTFERAQPYESENIRVFSYPAKGVSAARNRGSEHAVPDSDWLIFLDADTLLAPSFLTSLNSFMANHQLYAHAAGSMSIQPRSRNLAVRIFFRLGNFFRRFTKFPYVAFIIRRSLMERIQFDEEQEVGEDVRLFADACRYGRAFFFHTEDVATSTRNFAKGEWLTRSISWFSIMPLAGRAFHKVSYKVIR